ncbi:hypothetical protein [Corynebacterium kalidii]
MTDQTAPITDDDRQAHEWADHQLSLDVNDEVIVTAARAIKSHVPAPPKSLADELREYAEEYAPVSRRFALRTLADRVEAVEVENVSLRIERDQADYLMQKADRERDEARAAEKAVQRACDDWEAEARKVRGDLDEARAEVAAWMDANQALAGQHTATVAELDSARAEVERLTEQVARLDLLVDSLNDDLSEARGPQPPQVHPATDSAPLPDPADVPAGEAWTVEVCGERRPALKDNCPWVPWSTVAGNGVYMGENNDAVTLVARLVPDTRRVIDKAEDLDVMPVDSVVLDKDGDP